MTIGLPPYQNLNPSRFDWCLLLPFRPRKGRGLKEAHREVAKEKLLVAAGRVHLLEGVVQNLR